MEDDAGAYLGMLDAVVLALALIGIAVVAWQKKKRSAKSRRDGGDEKKGKTAVLAILVAMLVTAGLHMSGFSFFGGQSDPHSKESLTEVAATLNKNMPMVVDAETELTRVEGLEGVLVYHYRLVNHSAAQLNGADLRDDLQPNVVTAICGKPEPRKLLDQGVAFRYMYADKDMVPVTQIDVTIADCDG